MFENQIRAERPISPTASELPIPDLPEELWPHDVQPEAGLANGNVQNVDVDVANAEAQNIALSQMDDQDIGNVENFEDFQQTGPLQQSSPAQYGSQLLQPSGLSPILEVDIEPHGDNGNGMYNVHYHHTFDILFR